MQQLIVFPDTNVFLQCKALQDLHWKEIFDADHIDLLIGAPVQDEIDRLKQDGNHRRAKRARDTNKVFKQALDSADETVTIREREPRVVLKFAPSLPAQRATPQTLDLTRPDDRLIDEVLHYQTSVSSNGMAVRILTSDTGMKLRARRHHISVANVPDSWLLMPESDPRDKELSKLQAELQRLRSAAPILEVALQNETGETITSFSTTLPFYPQLSKHDIEKLIAEIESRHPRATDFGLDPPASDPPTDDPSTPFSQLFSSIQTAVSSMQKWRPPTQDEIKGYKQAYDEWIDKARGRFERLPNKLNAGLRIIPLQLQLRNTGSQPADEVLLECISYDGLQLCTSADEEIPEPIKVFRKLDRAVVLRQPPTAPKGEFVFAAFADSQRLGTHAVTFDADERLRGFPQLNTPVFNRDRHLFYRREGDSNPTTNSSFSCIELRHQSDAQNFFLWVTVPAMPGTLRTRLYFRVSARNVERPRELHVPLTIENKLHSTLEVAHGWAIEPGEERRISLFDLGIPTHRI